MKWLHPIRKCGKWTTMHWHIPMPRVIRKAMVNILPAGRIVLVPHDTFGMDLAPGLSIKMDSPFVADVR
jgi:electron transfer flavoprotein alpha subunit